MPKPKEEWANKMTEEIIKDINAIPEMSKIDFEIIGSIKELIRGGLRKYVYELPVELLQEQHRKTIEECIAFIEKEKNEWVKGECDGPTAIGAISACNTFITCLKSKLK